MTKRYDFLIVGSGLFGCVCANLLKAKGFNVIIIEKNDHIGGACYTENIDGINVHKFGAHIFHTSNKFIWDFVNKFASFNNFVNSPLANYHGEMYHLPFNMNTFVELWPDVKTPDDALRHIEDEKRELNIGEPRNLEEQAISLVGTTIYKKLIKEYTEKQWGKSCLELPSFIIKRLPVRFTFDNNYFSDKYQGIPVGGYTKFMQNLIEGIDVRLNADFFTDKQLYLSMAKKIIFTGAIDEYYDYRFGELEYRSLLFKQKLLKTKTFQNNAVVNYTSHKVPYTRIIEHKFFEFGDQDFTIISEEYPVKWELGKERFYTVNNKKNEDLYKRYYELSKKEKNIIFGGRLGLYKYLDMDDAIEAAFNTVECVVKEYEK